MVIQIFYLKYQVLCDFPYVSHAVLKGVFEGSVNNEEPDHPSHSTYLRRDLSCPPKAPLDTVHMCLYRSYRYYYR